MFPAPTNNILVTYGALQVLYYIVLYCIVALGSGVIFTKFKRRLNFSVFDDDTLCHAVTLIFDLLTLNFYNPSSVTCLKFKLNKI